MAERFKNVESVDNVEPVIRYMVSIQASRGLMKCTRISHFGVVASVFHPFAHLQYVFDLST